MVWREARELIWAHRGRLSLGLALMLVNRLSGLVLPATSKYLIDEVIMKGQGRPAHADRGGRGRRDRRAGATSFALSQVLGVAAQRAITDMRARSRRTSRACRCATSTRPRRGVLISRIMSDAEGIRNLVGTGLVQLVGGLLTAVVALGVLFYLNWHLTAVTLLRARRSSAA